MPTILSTNQLNYYTKEILEEAVKDSRSISEVMRKLGFKVIAGGSHANIKKRIKFFKINTSHFLGLKANSGIFHHGTKIINFEEILVYNRRNGLKEKTSLLRRALIESGIKEQCSTCGLLPEWNGKILRLQIDHKNGDPLDNRPGNHQFNCPNCHSQTISYAIGWKKNK